MQSVSRLPAPSPMTSQQQQPHAFSSLSSLSGRGGTNSNPGSKRAKYSSRVCAECARKHCKCNGVQPQCAPCATAGMECVWPEKKGVNLRDRVERLEKTNERMQLTISTLQATVEALQTTIERLQLAVDTGTVDMRSSQSQPTALAMPLMPGSPGPPSSFPSSTESSPHPGPRDLPVRSGLHLGVPPFNHPYARRHVRTLSGVSSTSEGSFPYEGHGSTHLGVPRRHARTLSGGSTVSDGGSDYEPYGSTQSSSPIGPVPALFVESAPAPAWHGHAGFNGLEALNPLGYPNVPVDAGISERSCGQRSGD